MGKEVLFGFELIDLYSIARCIHYIRQTWVSMIKNRDERDDVCSWRNGRLTLDITIEAWRKKITDRWGDGAASCHIRHSILNWTLCG
jgi:hypothetical protein